MRTLTRNWPDRRLGRSICLAVCRLRNHLTGWFRRPDVNTTYRLMKPCFPDVGASPFRFAPERQAALLALMKGSPFEAKLAVGPAQFTAYPTEERIEVASSGLASLWALTYVGYRYMDIASRSAASERGKASDQLTIHADPVFGELIDYARRLFVADEEWPDQLPRPTWNAAFDSMDGRINNLFMGATAWVVLHEICHVAQDHTAYAGREYRLTQEHEADRFAVRWPLEQAVGDQREFRILAITVALAWLFLFERAKRGGDDHPPAIIRFREAASWFELNDESVALENAVYLLKGIFDPENDGMPLEMGPQTAFDWIDNRLAELFPRP